MRAWLQEEEFREAEYEEEVYYCEPKQGSFLGWDDDEEVEKASKGKR